MYLCAYIMGIIFELVQFDLYAAFFQNKRACIFITIECKKKTKFRTKSKTGTNIIIKFNNLFSYILFY